MYDGPNNGARNPSPPIPIEEAACALCGSVERTLAYSGFEPYAVVRCSTCGFYYLSPRPTPDALRQLYDDDRYFEGEGNGYISYDEQETALRATFSGLLRHMQTHGLTGGALLDIGCGYGYLLEQAKGLYRIRIGTDFSSRAVKRAGAVADRVYKGGLDRVPQEERFDCVVALHVIEHLVDPSRFVAQAIRHLTPTGALVVATPDMNSFWRRLMGRRWPSFKIPEHVQFFNRQTLTTLLKSAGLADVRPIPYPHAFPLSLVASKLHWRVPPALGQLTVWLPATTVAVVGRISRG
ncbi:MAG: class I SAM-dependent methyltransferase [Nitrospirota bacterium]